MRIQCLKPCNDTFSFSSISILLLKDLNIVFVCDMLMFVRMLPFTSGERGGLVVNASDSGSRGRGFEPHSGQTVLCPSARHIYAPKVLVIPRKRWLHPNMTEKLFTGRVVKNQPTNLLHHQISQINSK